MTHQAATTGLSARRGGWAPRLSRHILFDKAKNAFGKVDAPARTSFTAGSRAT